METLGVSELPRELFATHLYIDRPLFDNVLTHILVLLSPTSVPFRNNWYEVTSGLASPTEQLSFKMAFWHALFALAFVVSWTFSGLSIRKKNSYLHYKVQSTYDVAWERGKNQNIGQKDGIHLYIWDFLQKQYNIHICRIKTETIIRQPPKDTIISFNATLKPLVRLIVLPSQSHVLLNIRQNVVLFSKRKSSNKTAHKNLWVFSQRNGPVNQKLQSTKGPQIIHKTVKTTSTLDYCSMGSGEQGNQISSKSRSFQCKIYESAQFPSTLSRVKCLFFRRAKELNRRCQCDVNLKKLVLRLSLFFPRNATLYIQTDWKLSRVFKQRR